MKKTYLIENIIIFNEESQEIFIDGESENMLTLPAPSARLLSELIKTNGSMVTRETLLTRVWEDHGYRASNSNLNNYLSILRRNLTALLPESMLITTLPKQGIIFQARVEEIASGQAMDENSAEAAAPLQPGGKKKGWLAGLVLGGTALLGAAMYLPQRQALPELPLQPAFTQAQCHFYVMKDNPLSRDDFLAILTRLNISLDCEQQPKDIFLTHHDAAHKRRHMAFVSWCERDEAGQYTQCENVKQLTWGIV